ncbi:hypothetical protein JAAARDRAFT_139562 [Jaapia argillacea MUCL 33604]|uniref:Prolyl 4-hydroxylase alpha subunit Fe(2+) 2OG dioxygenase domain-containing protein n=1 Tax=Jaapia argillacea MUCL 33604 TaxID=933084 RepID=A0A067PB08_9AGAM|nr:hypothetical protein JAAARDRAFT_139562 [Jaapia argillacea MUCL 33604]
MFQSFHFSVYNHHSTQAHTVPNSFHPLKMQCIDVAHTNHSQMVPHMLIESKEYDVIYHNLTISLADLFKWVEELVRKFFPEEFNILVKFCNVLPLNTKSPVYPLSALVVNLDVTTRSHRDRKDYCICIIIPWGKHTGDHFCIYELGLMFKMNPGDVCIFCSKDLTHFNLHFHGYWGSIVLHADEELQVWEKDRNGWEANEHMT